MGRQGRLAAARRIDGRIVLGAVATVGADTRTVLARVAAAKVLARRSLLLGTALKYTAGAAPAADVG